MRRTDCALAPLVECAPAHRLGPVKATAASGLQNKEGTCAVFNEACVGV